MFMRWILLLVTCLGSISCGKTKKDPPPQAVSFGTKNHGSLALPAEDVHVLKAHHPALLKKIKGSLAITVDDVIALQQLGFTSDIMIMIINYTESRFLLSTNDILRLQAEGVPFKVINYMIRM